MFCMHAFCLKGALMRLIMILFLAFGMSPLKQLEIPSRNPPALLDPLDAEEPLN